MSAGRDRLARLHHPIIHRSRDRPIMAANPTQKHLDLLGQLIERAKRAGAESADALIFQSESLAFRQRIGKPEMLERSESQDLGLRVLIGKRQAIGSSTDLGEPALDELISR